MAIQAVQHVRKMRGGAQGHLMRAEDGHYYVVKFRNNPQHPRVLANDYFATRLAEKLGLPVPMVEVITVDGWLVEHTPELRIEMGGQVIRCEEGLQFGSRFVIDPKIGEVFDYLPETMMERVKNLEAFAGALVLDKWTCNANGRQAAFWRKPRERKFNATFIDQGYCFNAGEWTFPDSPLRGVYLRNDVYAGVTGWESFEPWLSRVEGMSMEEIGECADGIPPEWYDNRTDEMERLVEMLYRRRERVRRLIDEFRVSSRQPFVNWSRPEALAAEFAIAATAIAGSPEHDPKKWD